MRLKTSSAGQLISVEKCNSGIGKPLALKLANIQLYPRKNKSPSACDAGEGQKRLSELTSGQGWLRNWRDAFTGWLRPTDGRCQHLVNALNWDKRQVVADVV